MFSELLTLPSPLHSSHPPRYCRARSFACVLARTRARWTAKMREQMEKTKKKFCRNQTLPLFRIQDINI